ncbi:MAG: DUF2089 family protein [Planctomycetes bacterium]|nr:DUF2089 family protein [Planctomycetota bacterium]
MAPPDSRPERLFRQLEETDQELVLRLVLASGSLKELAGLYGVSYPTIRGRLDRLIDRLARLRDGEPTDAMSELLARFVENGEITLPAAQRIRRLNRRLLDGQPQEST